MQSWDKHRAANTVDIENTSDSEVDQLQKYSLEWLKDKMLYGGRMRNFRAALERAAKEMRRLDIISTCAGDNTESSACERQTPVKKLPSAKDLDKANKSKRRRVDNDGEVMALDKAWFKDASVVRPSRESISLRLDANVLAWYRA